MLPPCDGCREQQPLYSRSPSKMYLKEPPPGSLSLFFWFPEICTAKPTGLLPAWMMAPFPIVPVEQRRKKNIKHNRKGVMLSLKCPFLSASNILLPNNYLRTVSVILSGVHGGEGGQERYCRSPQVGAESVTLSISLRFTGSPYTPKPHPAPRHIFQRGTRTARVNLNLILTGMFLAKRHRKVFLELSLHSNLWA